MVQNRAGTVSYISIDGVFHKQSRQNVHDARQARLNRLQSDINRTTRGSTNLVDRGTNLTTDYNAHILNNNGNVNQVMDKVKISNSNINQNNLGSNLKDQNLNSNNTINKSNIVHNLSVNHSNNNLKSNNSNNNINPHYISNSNNIRSNVSIRSNHNASLNVVDNNVQMNNSRNINRDNN